MKTINTYINEKLRLTSKRQYTCQPKDKSDLRDIIIDRLENEGDNCDLNDIDVSKITDMNYLFLGSYIIFKTYNFDISQWDVSNVTDMHGMFYGCENFNCDISMWNVKNVKSISNMFWNCKNFKQNLDSWDVSSIEYMYNAFDNCPTKPIWYNKR